MAETQVGENGCIPASKRPDGTWRKARRVKEGYVPPEEAEKYQSKGKQWIENTSSSLPPGLAPEEEKAAIKMSKNRKKNERKKQQRKEKNEEDDVIHDGVEEVTLPMSATSLNDEKNMDDETRAKKTKNLRKKLRQIEELEGKIASGEISELSDEQQEKMNRKKELNRELKRLES